MTLCSGYGREGIILGDAVKTKGVFMGFEASWYVVSHTSIWRRIPRSEGCAGGLRLTFLTSAPPSKSCTFSIEDIFVESHARSFDDEKLERRWRMADLYLVHSRSLLILALTEVLQ